MKTRPFTHKALVLGRISLVRSLGREGVPVVLAREGRNVFERASRYTREFILLPDLVSETDAAAGLLEDYGRSQGSKPVPFFNGESDVRLFSANREQLSRFYLMTLAPHSLIEDLLNKGRFAKLAERFALSTPRTLIPETRDDCLAAAREMGYPCVLKPVEQREWHRSEVLDAIGLHKALLLTDESQLQRYLDVLRETGAYGMIQQYIPGDDQHHYDFHAYVDREGTVVGWVVGNKLRTFPVHFGQGCYTRFVEEPAVAHTCLEALQRLDYRGPVNINLKRHSGTGKDYILEINPRYSLWTIFDAACGVNLPLGNYLDAVGERVSPMKAHGMPVRWLWLGADFKAMRAYRRCGELTLLAWIKSFFSHPGRIEHHVFAWDDPFPALASVWYSCLGFSHRLIRGLKRPLGRVKATSVGA
jgi:D-aspartate ligase